MRYIPVLTAGNRTLLISLLSDQVSNLDSSEPKSDVLPVTPSDNFPPYFRLGAQIYVDFFVFKTSSGKFSTLIHDFFQARVLQLLHLPDGMESLADDGASAIGHRSQQGVRLPGLLQKRPGWRHLITGKGISARPPFPGVGGLVDPGDVAGSGSAASRLTG